MHMLAGWGGWLAGRLTGWPGSLPVTNLVHGTDWLAEVLPGPGRCVLAVWEGWPAWVTASHQTGGWHVMPLMECYSWLAGRVAGLGHCRSLTCRLPGLCRSLLLYS